MKSKTILPFLIIFAFFSAVLFISCESYQTIELVVKDAETLSVLDSVFVDIKAGKNGNYEMSGTSGYTDSLGNFSGSFMIGCTFGCYDIFVVCSKSGYKKYTSEMNEIEEIVLLEKE